ncbi:MAG: MBL fold metallo-hydrolase [Desulfurococcales archaeon]|nr:MBL fold metallo-hydrolase [Desulfurococcales archaeon]
MKLIVLGLGSSYPPPGYGGPGLLLDNGIDKLLIDCGKSCMESLLQLGYTPCDIHKVYVTHSHIDHVYGVFEFLVGKIASRCPDLTILAHEEVLDTLMPLLDLLAPSKARIDYESITSYNIGDYTLIPWRAKHSIPTYGVILARSSQYAMFYTSDTGYTEDLERVVSESKIVLLEVTLSSSHAAETEYHLSVKDFLRLSGLGEGLIVPVHLSPESLEEIIELLGRGWTPRRRIVFGRPPLLLSLD